MNEISRTEAIGPQLVSPYLTLRIKELSSVLPSESNDALDDAERQWSNDTWECRTGLDSHTNMAMVGSGTYIVEETEHTEHVKSYSLDYDTKEIPIIHAGVLYKCPYKGI